MCFSLLGYIVQTRLLAEPVACGTRITILLTLLVSASRRVHTQRGHFMEVAQWIPRDFSLDGGQHQHTSCDGVV